MLKEFIRYINQKTVYKFILLLFYHQALIAQIDTNLVTKNKPINLFVSAGSHVSLFNLSGITIPSAQIQTDINVVSNFFVGMGYAFDHYNEIDLIFTRSISYSNRHNVRLRIYNYFGDFKKPIMGYSGISMGLSYWQSNYSSSALNINSTSLGTSVFPSLQVYFGLKTTIYNRIFNISELAFGSPYFIQTSFGYKF